MGFQITGWKAVLALAGIAAFAGFRYYTRVSTLEKEGREALHLWLAAEYSRDVLESIPSNAAAAPAEQQAAAEELLAQQNVAIHDIRARGRGDTIFVRAKVSVNAREPRDGRQVRYFMMSHSMLTGWRLLRETTALRYYLDW
jgi:hypothetical protein